MVHVVKKKQMIIIPIVCVALLYNQEICTSQYHIQLHIQLSTNLKYATFRVVCFS